MSQSSLSYVRRSGFTSILWALLSVGLFCLISAIWVSETGSSDLVSQGRARRRIELREKLDMEDTQRLATVTWIDRANGVVQIPISRAKEVALDELRKRHQAPSTVPLDPVLPQPPKFDPNSSEPLPSALPSSPQGADTIRFISPVPEALTSSPGRPESENGTAAKAPESPSNGDAGAVGEQ